MMKDERHGTSSGSQKKKTDHRKKDNIYHKAPFRLVNINMYLVLQGKL